MTVLPPLTRIALADDHAIVLEGLKLLLSCVEGVEVVGTAVDGAGLRTLLASETVDLLVLDMHMPGLEIREFLAEIRSRLPAMRVLVLTGDGGSDAMAAVLDAGAHGFLLKRSDVSELLPAIEALRLGQTYIGAGLEQHATAVQSASADGGTGLTESRASLTRRETEILALIAQGATTTDIAIKLSISPLTARKHRENLMRKLALHNTAEVVAYAVRTGIRTV